MSADPPVVSSAVVLPGNLPPLRERDLPEPIPLRRMIGPSIILAGLALGSGEFVLWPYITFHSRFVFFWACLLAVVMQYFLNLEIMRWTLATGESALAGIIRLWRPLAVLFLVLNVVPWMIPAWAKGAGEMIGWLIASPQFGPDGKMLPGAYDNWLAMAGLLFCGAILTAGPVLYETVERVQMLLVGAIMLLVVGLAAWLLVLRPDALVVQATTTLTLGAPQFFPRGGSIDSMMLLGALAFAGAGGTMNLAQSNYIRDKGYAMGRHIGRITSPITGQEEAITEIGFHFPHTAENLRRWSAWWRAACWEHFVSFLCTCLVCLVLLTLIAYICFFGPDGQRVVDATVFADNTFIWAEAGRIAELVGPLARHAFMLMGVAILFTTEFGVLDAASRISTDVVKVAWLRENKFWSEGRLYYAFLWGEIALACAILLLDEWHIKVGTMQYFKLAAAMNGGVMFLYAMALVVVNRWRLPAAVRIPAWRLAILVATAAFFGFFTVWAGFDLVRFLLSGPNSAGPA
jgi:hypothetical protein